MKPGTHPLRMIRIHYNLTQKRLAEEVGVSEQTIMRAESNIPINAESRRLVCKYFNMTSEQLGLITEENKAEENKAEEQQQTIAQQLAEPEVASGIVVSAHNNVINDINLDDAESIINLAWETWFASKPKMAAWEVNKLLPKLQHMLHTHAISTHRLRLQELIIRCHGLLGAIGVDALQNNTALYHYTHAYQISAGSHDIDQATTYLALIGDTFRRQGEKGRAISSMENARNQAIHVSRATQGHILQLLAYTYADTGNAADFERTILEAADLLAFSNEATDTAKKEFVPFEVYEIRGKASRDLGKPLSALKYLDLADQSLNGEIVTPRWHAMLDISKGQAYCDAGDISTGVALARRGFLQAYQCHSLRQMNRVRKLLGKLAASQWKNDKNIAELKELLHETYMHMSPET